MRIRYDDRLIPDLEGVVGPGNVRLLGQRGATARVEPLAQPALSSQVPASGGSEVELYDSTTDESDDD